ASSLFSRRHGAVRSRSERRSRLDRNFTRSVTYRRRKDFSPAILISGIDLRSGERLFKSLDNIPNLPIIAPYLFFKVCRTRTSPIQAPDLFALSSTTESSTPLRRREASFGYDDSIKHLLRPQGLRIFVHKINHGYPPEFSS